MHCKSLISALNFKTNLCSNTLGICWISINNKHSDQIRKLTHCSHHSHINNCNTIRQFHTIKENNKHSWSILKNVYKKQLTTGKKKYACFLLNISSDDSYKHFEKYKYIWNEANLKVAVNGSANCLAKKRIIHTADIVCGDFDSIDNKLIQQLRCPSESAKYNLTKDHQPGEKCTMPQIIETPCQKETDFTKALRVSTSMRPDIQFFCALYRSDGSRIDHLFGLVNTMHLIKKDIVIVNVKSNTFSWLLHGPGEHIIEKPTGRELCSLVPFTGPTEVETHGLEYNTSSSNPLSFGGTISTSNICSKNCESITVKTNRDLLWSIDVGS